MSPRRDGFLTLFVLVAVLASSSCGAKREPESSEPEAEPYSGTRIVFTKARVRDGSKKRFGPNREIGDLVFYDDRVELVDDEGWSIPYSHVRRVSIGRLPGDVDSDWIVLDTEDPQVADHVAFRDGKRFGFAARTREWYGQVREVLRAARAAQFAAPEGFESFDALESHLSFVYPQGWKIEVVGTEIRDGANVGGAFRIVGPGRTDVLVERRPDVGRRWCAGIPEAEVAALAEEAARSDRWAGGGEQADPFLVEPVTVDRCAGVRMRGTGPRGEVDLVAVSLDGTLTLLGLRCPAGCAQPDREMFDALVASVSFPDARPAWVK